jgi:acyl carrier protein
VQAAAEFREGPKLRNVKLTVCLRGSSEITFSADRVTDLPVDLVFTKAEDGAQSFKAIEIVYTLLDKYGEELSDEALGLREEKVGDTIKKEIELTAHTTHYYPDLFVWPKYLADGQEYYLVVRVRNRTALVRFVAKKAK